MDSPLSVSTSRAAFKRLRLLIKRTTFTSTEVRQRLRQDRTSDPRTAAVHAAAARTSIWSSLLPDNAAAELGRAGRCLPMVVYWYCQGMPHAEIGKRLSLFGSAWDAERAVEVASTLIAYTLNEPGFASEFAA